MHRGLVLSSVVALLVALLLAQTVRAQDDSALSAPPVAAGAWKLETVVLASGKEHRGLIEQEDPASIEFVDVYRPRGKPMYLVVRTIERRSIERWQRLSAAEQTELRGRIQQFRNRARIEARRMEDLQLEQVRRDGALHWQYKGDWFTLDSTTDEETTRRSVVRIEQVFTAFRHLLPPHSMPMKRLEIVLFGSTGQYREFLGGLGLEIANPAFFAADFNLLAAASEMNQFVAEMQRVREQHQSVRQEYERQMAGLADRLKELSDDLEKNKVPADQRKAVIAAEREKWKKQGEALAKSIATIERRNAARFDEVSGRMFARLYHEAFHAYLDNFAYPHQQFDVPRWLNEGLAQTFESGFLEVDTLRIDAPSKPLLASLQRDLAADEPLGLSELLTADANTFLAAHRSDPGQASRLYLYAWGLAYYLTFEQPLVGTPAFDRYVSPEAAALEPVERFEQFVGMSLSKFEPRWRTTMGELKP